MLGNRQFSLGYLMLEVFWIAVALAFTRAAIIGWMAAASAAEAFQLSGLPISVAILIWSIAIGGLWSRMTAGAGIGMLLFWLSWVLLPAFMF